nr:MAG TPA: hypothetical protein [Caudoviricetes sp.]
MKNKCNTFTKNNLQNTCRLFFFAYLCTVTT